MVRQHSKHLKVTKIRLATSVEILAHIVTGQLNQHINRLTQNVAVLLQMVSVRVKPCLLQLASCLVVACSAALDYLQALDHVERCAVASLHVSAASKGRLLPGGPSSVEVTYDTSSQPKADFQLQLWRNCFASSKPASPDLSVAKD